MPPRSGSHNTKAAKRIGGFLLWIATLLVAAVLLLLVLFYILGYSLHHMRIAVCILVTLVFAFALWGLHARARGKPRLIFLMKVVLGLLCVSVLVAVWSLSTTVGSQPTWVKFENQTDSPLLVKVVEIGKRGLLSDNAYNVTLPPHGAQAIRMAESGEGMSFAVIVSEYQAGSGAADLSFLGGLGEGISRAIQATSAPAFRAVYAAGDLPAVLAFRKRSGQLALVRDGEPPGDDDDEDAFALPVPGGKR